MRPILKSQPWILVVAAVVSIGTNQLFAAPISQEVAGEASVKRSASRPKQSPFNLALFFAEKIESDRLKVSRFLEIAGGMVDLGSNDEARSVLMEAADLAEKSGPVYLLRTATLLKKVGMDSEADRCTSRAIELCEELPANSFQKINALRQVVPILAVADTDRAVELVRDIEVVALRDSALSRAASELVRNKQDEKAIAISMLRLQLAEDPNNQEIAGDVTRRIDEIIGKTNDGSALVKAEEWAGSLEDIGRKSTTLANIARSLARIGEKERAITVADRAANEMEALTDAQKMGVRNLLATALATAGEFDHAIQMARQIDSESFRVSTIISVADLMTTDDPNGARELLAEVSKQVQETESSLSKSAQLRVIGTALIDAGDRTKGIALLKQAYDECGDVKNDFIKSSALTVIGAKLAEAGESQSALLAFRDAAKCAEDIDVLPMRPIAYSQILSGLVKMGETDRASAIAQLAARAALSSGEPQSHVAALRTIAGSAEAAGLQSTAQEIFAMAIAPAEKLDESSRKGTLNGIARDLARVDDLDSAMRAIESTTDPNSRVYSLGQIASGLISSGNDEKALNLLDQSVEVAGKIKGENSYASAIKRIAKQLIADERAGANTSAMKSGFSPAEQTLANRIIQATRRENTFLKGLRVAILKEPGQRDQRRPSLPSLNLDGGPPKSVSTFTLTARKQQGVLRIESTGVDLAVTGFVKNLRPGDHEILMGVTVGPQPNRSHSSSLTIVETDGSEITGKQKLQLATNVFVPVEKLGQIGVNEEGTASIRLKLAGKSVAHLDGRPLFVRAIRQDEKESNELTEAVACWGFVVTPDSRLSSTDDDMWAEVFPDLKTYDLPRSAYERALLTSLPSFNRGYERPETLNSIGLKAVELDGKSGYISTSIRHDGKQPITLEAWVKPDDLSGHREIICNAQAAGMVIGFYDGVCKFILHDGVRYREVKSTSPVKVNKTVHVAGVFDGSRMDLFVDGKRQGSGARVAGNGKPSVFPLLIGANPQTDQPIKFFSGVIDEVRISSIPRYRANFTPPRRLESDANTVAVFQFDEGSGDVARDASRNGNDAQIRGGSRWITDQRSKQKAYAGPAVDEKFWAEPSEFSVFLARNTSNISSKVWLLSGVNWQKISEEEKQKVLEDLRRSAKPGRPGMVVSMSVEQKIQLATALGRAGDADTALRLLNEATETTRENKSLLGRLNDQWRIVSALAEIGAVDQATQFAGEIDEFPIDKDRSSGGTPAPLAFRQSAELSIATAMARAGDRDEAIKRLQQAANWANQLPTESLVSSVLAQIAPALAELGEFDEAIQHAEKITSAISKASTLDRIAEALVDAGENEKARALLTKAIASIESLGSSGSRSALLTGISATLKKAGDAAQAEKLIGQATMQAEQSADFLRRSISQSEPAEGSSFTRRRNNIRWLIRDATTLAALGKRDLATSLLNESLEEILKSGSTVSQNEVYDITRVANGWVAMGDQKQALDTLSKALALAEKMPRSIIYSRENPREQSIANIGVSLSQILVSVNPFRRVAGWQAKPSFNTAEKTLSRRIASVCARGAEIDTARNTLRSGGSQAVQQYSKSEDPEIAWLAALADLQRRFTLLSRTDRADIAQMIDDFKTLVGDRDYDQDARLAADRLIMSLERSEHQDLLGDLYQFIGTKMSESTDRSLKFQSSKMLAKARWLSLPGNSIQISGTTIDGKELDWESYRGKVVLIDFWASWCAPCRKEHRSFKRSLDVYADKGFAVIGINLDNTLEACQQYIDSQELTWPILRSKNPRESGVKHPIAVNYDITRLPTCILVDRDGKVVSLNARGGELDRSLRNEFGESPLVANENVEQPGGAMATRANPLARLAVSATGLGDLYMRQSDLKNATKHYNEAIKYDPSYGPAHRGLGDVLIRQGKVSEALNEFRTAIKVDPKLSSAYNNLAWALVTHPDEDGDYQNLGEAVTAARKACELDVDNLGSLNTLGVALYRNGDWDEAIEALEDSVDLGADVPHNWLFIAMANWKKGNKEEAQTLLAKSLAWRQKNRQDDEIKRFFAEAERLIGPVKALEVQSDPPLTRVPSPPSVQTQPLLVHHDSAVYLMDVDGAQMRRVERVEGYQWHSHPNLSPNGEFLAWAAHRNQLTQPSVFVGDLSGKVSFRLEGAVRPGWLSDQSLVVEKANKIVRVDLRPEYKETVLMEGNRYARSVNGRFMVYVRGAAIVIRDMETGGEKNVQLDPPARTFNGLAVSNDGQKIAYVGLEDRGQGLFVANVDDGKGDLIADEPGQEYSPDFSLDDTKLLLTAGNVRLSEDSVVNRICLVDLVTKMSKVLTSENFHCREANWSSDGKTIVLVAIEKSVMDEFLRRGGVPIDQRESGLNQSTEPVDRSADSVRKGVARPRISFRSMQNGEPGTFVMTDTGANITLLSDGVQGDGPKFFRSDEDRMLYIEKKDGTISAPINSVDDGVSLSPDGTKIAFQSREAPPYPLVVMDFDGSQATTIVKSMWTYTPVFSPDGSKIAFMGNRSGDLEIFVVNADGSSLKQLTRAPGRDGGLDQGAWSPDGSKLTFMSERDGKPRQIYVMNADGSHQTRLVTGSWPHWVVVGSNRAYQPMAGVLSKKAE